MYHQTKSSSNTKCFALYLVPANFNRDSIEKSSPVRFSRLALSVLKVPKSILFDDRRFR